MSGAAQEGKDRSVMQPGLSAYLDLLRFGAAMLVFLSHLSWNRISGGFMWQLQPWGHYGVIIFFVLSGYVIQHVAATKENNFFDYQVARFGRLYSVVIPALILTFVFEHIGLAADPGKYELGRQSEPLLRLVASGLFLSQSWGWDLFTFGNDPFWSLPYEFWYYQIFAALIFFRGWKRIALVTMAVLLSGVPILIFLPIWMAGVVAYRLSQAVKLSQMAAVILFILSIMGFLLALFAQAKGLFPRTTNPFWPTNYSHADFFSGFCVAANLYAASFISFRLGVLRKPIVAAAGISFSLYLLHVPLLRMISAWLPADLPVSARGIILFVSVLLAVWALSFVTERRKKEWRNFFRWLFSLAKSAESAPKG